MSFEDSGRVFEAGTLIVTEAEVIELSKSYAIDMLALSNIPEGAIQMKPIRIAVNGDEGVRHALRVLGFDYDEISAQDINAGLITEYDVFINQGQSWSGISQNGGKAR